MCVYDREREKTRLLGIWHRVISPSVRREKEIKKEMGHKCERDMAFLRYSN